MNGQKNSSKEWTGHWRKQSSNRIISIRELDFPKQSTTGYRQWSDSIELNPKNTLPRCAIYVRKLQKRRTISINVRTTLQDINR